VTNVSWNACKDFIKKLNAKMDGGYRLPTEAEWEYACRAGTSTAYSYGNEITPKDANYNESSIGEAVEVGSYKPNAFGLYDMHGNVWEWCEDWYGSLQNGNAMDPKGAATGDNRCIRGGSFLSIGSKARSSFRNDADVPVNRSKSSGFRLARTMNIEGLSEPDIKEFLFKVKKEQEAKTEKEQEAKTKKEEEAKRRKEVEETKAKEAQKKEAMILHKEVEDKIDLGKRINLEMVLIPSGKFMMGSPVSEKAHRKDETQHEVTLTKPFYMGKYEVTQEQWETIMGDNPSKFKSEKLPVTNVSWLDCQEFIKKLNAETNGEYRLPTEAEWEYACRAGTSTAFSYGDSITKSDANYGGSEKKAVGSYKPNAFGLHDMHGNVWEWCEDWYADYPKESVIDPKGPATGGSRVLRGGPFNLSGFSARSSDRGRLLPSARSDDGGFRLAKTP